MFRCPIVLGRTASFDAGRCCSAEREEWKRGVQGDILYVQGDWVTIRKTKFSSCEKAEIVGV